MGNLNFQDVIRDVHDPANHALQISGTISAAGQATVTLYGTPTIFAVVNTSAAGQASVVLDNSLSRIGFATVAVSTPTLFAVVNTGAVGVGESLVTINPRTDYIGLMSVSGNVNISSLPTINAVVNVPSSVGITGNVTLSDSKGYIGLTTATVASLPTINAVVNLPTSVGISGNVTLSDSKTYIGLVSVSGAVGLSAGIAGIGFATVAVSTPTLYAVVNTTASAGFQTIFVGTPTLFAVVNTGAAGVGESLVTINPRTDYFGLVSVSGNVNLNAGINGIGFATVALSTPTINAVVNLPSSVGIAGNVTLSDAKTYVGLVSVSGTVGLAAGIAGIGFATVAVSTPTLFAVVNNPSSVGITGNVTLSDSKGFIGLTTAISVNGGSNKVWQQRPIALSASGNSTIFVPSNTFKVTHLMMNSDATVRMTLLSGATYLVGNASVGVTLSPTGGWVQDGSVDSPVYIGLAAAAGLVVNLSANANVGGMVTYFDE